MSFIVKEFDANIHGMVTMCVFMKKKKVGLKC